MGLIQRCFPQLTRDGARRRAAQTSGRKLQERSAWVPAVRAGRSAPVGGRSESHQNSWCLNVTSLKRVEVFPVLFLVCLCFNFSFISEYIGCTVLSCFPVDSKVIGSHIRVCPVLFRFFSHVVYYIGASRRPYARQ